LLDANLRQAREEVAPEELRRLMDEGRVTVLDVRPAEEFLAGHIPGAISAPLEELEHRLDQLPADREVILYCRGPYCLLADQAAQLLSERGIPSLRMPEGVPEWEAGGRPLERAG
jgi:ArsR family transcriptional regulator